jgi:hypothetical protein
MRRAIPTLASLLIFLTMTFVWARRGVTHRPPPGVRPPHEAPTTPDGDDQAEVIVQDLEMVPSDRPGAGIDAIQGVPQSKKLAYVVHFEVSRLLQGVMPGRQLKILVHSPSADLGVRSGSRRGVLHRYRSGSGGHYVFVPESSRRGDGP